MSTQTLIAGIEAEDACGMGSDDGPKAAPRLRKPDRAQVLMEPCCLEDRLPADHPARAIWAVVGKLDLSAFYEPLQARGSEPGRSATDPKLLVALWLYAATEGVGNGRELDRLCQHHDAYRWLCGSVPVNYHTLNDFRVEQEKALDDLLTQVLAALMAKKVVTVKRISQDGTRVRAGAGSSSFHREKTLKDHLQAAQEQVEALKRQGEEGPAEWGRRQAAQERAAREREERITAALAELPKIVEAKAKQKAKPSKDRPGRASSTDPEARVMKMGDGGFRPAYNVQLAADPQSRAIVGVQVTNAGSDANLNEAMRKQVERRTGGQVDEHLMDGGFVQLAGIERETQAGVTIYAPPPTPKKEESPYTVRKGDSPEVAAWRQRMGTEEAKTLYKLRASTSETVNADLKSFRGLHSFAVRGLTKVICVTLWSVLAYNVMRFASTLIQT